MKYLRRLCAVGLLALAFSFSALASDILTPGTKKSAANIATETCNSEPSDILTPGAALDSITEAALSLLQSLLLLF